MRPAVESKAYFPQDIFWQTQLPGLRGPAELWDASKENLLLKKDEFSTAQKDHEIYFENQLVGILRISGSEELSFDCEALASFMYWNEAPFLSRLQLLSSLYEIRLMSPSFNWVGIYRLTSEKPDELVVSVFIGDPTPHRRISIHQGICGAAIREGATLNIADVKEDKRYLSCSLSTKSELVIPIRNSRQEIVAELDIDCTQLDGFSGAMENNIHRICERIERIPNLF